MAQKKSKLILTLAAISMVILVLDPQTALSGVQTGIDLCIKTVIPSLFPFFFLTSVITSAINAQTGRLQFIGKIIALPQGTESLFLLGIISGYPVGAQCVSRLYRNGQIDRSSAQRLMVMCNNPGPSFIFGLLGSVFNRRIILWGIWLIQILSAILIGLILKGGESYCEQPKKCSDVSFKSYLDSAVKSICSVCGCVIIFRVLINLCNKYLFFWLPLSLQISLSGILELTNGCLRLNELKSDALRLLLCVQMLSFGGICVHMQTQSVCGQLSIRDYFKGKLAQSIISTVLAAALLPLMFDHYAQYRYITVIIAFLLLVLSIYKKGVEKSSEPLYNRKKKKLKEQFHAVS